MLECDKISVLFLCQMNNFFNASLNSWTLCSARLDFADTSWRWLNGLHAPHQKTFQHMSVWRLFTLLLGGRGKRTLVLNSLMTVWDTSGPLLGWKLQNKASGQSGQSIHSFGGGFERPIEERSCAKKTRVVVMISAPVGSFPQWYNHDDTRVIIIIAFTL